METVTTSARCGLVTLVALLLAWVGAYAADHEAGALPAHDVICESATESATDDGESVAMSDELCCWVYIVGEWLCLPCGSI